jgi:hypothetical protein
MVPMLPPGDRLVKGVQLAEGPSAETVALSASNPQLKMGAAIHARVRVVTLAVVLEGRTWETRRAMAHLQKLKLEFHP